ncbi:LytR/AlgR family response regulator transcription factor [Opitutus terrae]|uniref:Two component transcriptional regulator, LytTR family n=1 Tax=Opitutus terrae (strain DSM 11246 / JCM 15787 / PB90-1) TaxID=452637 RepID=B1ZZB5_OPITP|nr:LytTR family DNA-binding domain-containing protein [Opitutus terrae]ACB77187.1 two component transcriptional regulator, LytTR family [Opitutus terrae PB90-1]
MKVRVLIVDDEPLARSVIRHWLADKRGAEIVGECGNGVAALELLRQQRVDVLFLDVQMPEMDGFALLRRARAIEIPVVIFVTAYDKYALQAFAAHALDYLLKPFDKERFDHAFKRARLALEQVRAAGEYRTRVRALLDTLELPVGEEARAQDRQLVFSSRLALRQDGKIVLVRTSDVHWLEAEGDYVRIHTRERRHLLHDTLSHLATQLDPRLFVRVHRSAVVNVECIRELEPSSNGEFEIVLVDGRRLHSSRTHRDDLLAALGRPAG